ncbi:MAG: hypothetical protein Q9160_003884 [Pyrenula sp. 1 TL-2023]
MAYSPLNQTLKEIRLISILPSQEDQSIVHCTLNTVSLLDYRPIYADLVSLLPATRRKRSHLSKWIQLASTPDRVNQLTGDIPCEEAYRFNWGDHAALSYAWGDKNNTKSIKINGVEVQVTKNLESLLRLLRKRSSFRHSHKLWADAICIDQRNDAERGSQVAMMRDIFDGSWTVVSWLGEEADESAAALDLLRTLVDQEVRGLSEQLKDKLISDPGHLGAGKWLALQNLLLRPYWSRLWTVQEIALAPDNMLILCGKDSIEWKQVQDGLTSIHVCHWYVKDACLKYDRKLAQEAQDLVNKDPPHWDTQNLHHIDKDLARIARNEARGDEPLSFIELLYAANATQCSQPIDKVYGLLAIMNPAISSQITPYYKTEPAALFARVAQLYTSWSGDLNILMEGSAWNLTQTPSWAPDWTGPGKARIAKETPRIIVDEIDSLGALADNRATSSDYKFSEESLLQPSTSPGAFGDNDAIRSALRKALTGDRLGWMCQDPSTADEAFSIFNLPSSAEAAIAEFQRRGWEDFAIQGHRYVHLQNWRHAHRNLRLGNRRFDDLFTDEIPSGGEDVRDGLWFPYRRWRSVVSGRRLVTTRAGRFGWVIDNPMGGVDAPEQQVQRGDLFCVAFGCRHPLVIRSIEGIYQVLGEGYLQGFMNGEALNGVAHGELHAQDLTFC